MVATSIPKRLLFINTYALNLFFAAKASTNAIPPSIAPKTFLSGIVQNVQSDMKLAEVYGCCTLPSDEECDVSTNNPNRHFSRALIGKMPQMTTEQALSALESATKAWNGGSGPWPQMSLSQRIAAVQSFLSELQHKREEIVEVLMWEIGKNRVDAESEFDRTVEFAKQTSEYIRTSSEFGRKDSSNGNTRLFLSRAAVGIVLCLGPYNYPLNETYAALIPALLMGNVVILKIPTVGGLAHLLTMEAFEKSFPKGTVNFISGSGRSTMPPLMESGKIDSLAFSEFICIYGCIVLTEIGLIIHSEY